MNKLFVALAVCALLLCGSFAQAQEVSGSVNGDGFIVVTGTGNPMAAGLDIVSAGSNLVPIPPGTTAAPADPFSFLLANSNQQVTFGNLGTTVSLEGELVTMVGYNSSSGADPAVDLAASTWGNGPTPVSIPFAGTPVIPEPATGLMAVFGALGVLGFRRRR